MEGLMRHYTLHSMLSQDGGPKKRKVGGGEGRSHHRHHLPKGRSRSAVAKHLETEGSSYPSPLFTRRHAEAPLTGFNMTRLHELTLCMEMADFHHYVREDPIGDILIPIKSSKYENHFARGVPRPPGAPQQDCRGEILLSLCYSAPSKKLSCVVVKAKNLPRKDLTTSTDPYVKLSLLLNGSRIDKRKTSVKSQTSTPIYHEIFTFIVMPNRIQEVQLVASVLDFDVVNNNRDVGHVTLGARVGQGESGQIHWEAMLARPGYPASQWHKLAPTLQ